MRSVLESEDLGFALGLVFRSSLVQMSLQSLVHLIDELLITLLWQVASLG